jgi:hypothetical protein
MTQGEVSQQGIADASDDIVNLPVFVKDIGGQFRINKGAMVASDRDLAHQIWGPVASGNSRPPCLC